jgi:hypothetical protein
VLGWPFIGWLGCAFSFLRSLDEVELLAGHDAVPAQFCQQFGFVLRDRQGPPIGVLMIKVYRVVAGSSLVSEVASR